MRFHANDRLSLLGPHNLIRRLGFFVCVVCLCNFQLPSVAADAQAESGMSETAIAALKDRAELGNAVAQYNLGAMYYWGDGVAVDYSEAGYWFLKAANQGIVEAQHSLGLMHGKGEGFARDEAEARRWFQVAAQNEYADAQFELGLSYESGNGGLQDYAEARKWFRSAAEQGHALAQKNLGWM